MRRKTLAAVLLALLPLSSAWISSRANAESYRGDRWSRSNVTVESGSTLRVRLDSEISTRNAERGDSWTGTVEQAVYSGNEVVIPEGSRVNGTVTYAAEGSGSTRPQIGLQVRRVNVEGRNQTLYADTQPIVAGTARAKQIGAIAGGAAAGALLGHAVARGSHGALIGGLIGGAAGYGLTRNSFRTLELRPGTMINFTVRRDVAMRR